MKKMFQEIAQCFDVDLNDPATVNLAGLSDRDFQKVRFELSQYFPRFEILKVETVSKGTCIPCEKNGEDFDYVPSESTFDVLIAINDEFYGIMPRNLLIEVFDEYAEVQLEL